MSIKAFPLSWRWTQPTHSELPAEVLETLLPLTGEHAGTLHAPPALGPRAERHRSESIDETRMWLARLRLPAGRVHVVWSTTTALSMPWEVFVAYWSDFCYPSSDDVDVYAENGRVVLRWHHDEVFEYDADAL
jgi:hypothetical protein